MSEGLPMVPLSEVLEPISRPTTPVFGKVYRQLGVQLWGRGAYEREPLDGSSTKYATLSEVKTSDVVVNKIWARNGSVAVVQSSLDGCFVSGEFPTFLPKLDRVDPRWIHWLTKTSSFWKQCDEKSQGTSGKNRIKPEQFLKVEIPLPPLDEQRRIVARIEDMSKIIQQAASLQNKMLEESQTVLLTRLNAIFGNPYCADNGQIGNVPLVRLNDVVLDVADGPHVTPHYMESGIPFITVLNITSGHIRFANHKFISEDDHREFQKRAKAEKGDVLVSKDGTLGIPCYVDTNKDFSFFVSVALIKPNRSLLDGEYLCWVIRSPYIQERIQERSRGDMIRHLVLREIRDLLIPLPDISQQRAIVELLNRLQMRTDELGKLNEECISHLEALMPSILDKAFKGEL